MEMRSVVSGDVALVVFVWFGVGQTFVCKKAPVFIPTFNLMVVFVALLKMKICTCVMDTCGGWGSYRNVNVHRWARLVKCTTGSRGLVQIVSKGLVTLRFRVAQLKKGWGRGVLSHRRRTLAT